MRDREIQQTRASFDYQWSCLPDPQFSPAHAEFRAEVADCICRLTQLEPAWFRGKSVLDAGCGAGRYTFGLCSLGAKVVALDRSMPGLRATLRVCSEFSNLRGRVAADLLCPLPFHEPFDLVWSYGVLHHTGDSRRAFRNLAALVRPGGRIFVMIYGEPRPEQLEDYKRLAALEEWRLRYESLPFPAKSEALRKTVPAENVLEYFDAVSPWINDTHRYADLQAWFDEEGFVDLYRGGEGMDHYLVARRAGNR